MGMIVIRRSPHGLGWLNVKALLLQPSGQTDKHVLKHPGRGSKDVEIVSICYMLKQLRLGTIILRPRSRPKNFVETVLFDGVPPLSLCPLL